MTEFKENLHTLRRRKKLSQPDLSKLCGICVTTISLYETGNREPNLSRIIKLAEVLGCSYNELLGEPEKEDKDKILINGLRELRDSFEENDERWKHNELIKGEK